MSVTAEAGPAGVTVLQKSSVSDSLHNVGAGLVASLTTFDQHVLLNQSISPEYENIYIMLPMLWSPQIPYQSFWFFLFLVNSHTDVHRAEADILTGSFSK